MPDAPSAVWTPSPAAHASARMARFFTRVSAADGTAPPADAPYVTWHRWSCEHPERFWPAVWREAAIVADSDGPPESVLVGGNHMRPPGPDGPRWFPGARLNAAENLLRPGGDGPAIIARDEAGRRRAIAHADLRDWSGRVAAALQRVYRDFGFHDIAYKIATRPAKRVGSDAVWDKAEQALRVALERAGLDYQVLPGEGAFYGPKIEYHLKDSIGRPWQCGTIQVDFSMPERLGAEYVAEDNTRKTPVMLHRAIVGSMERFLGILIENHAGAMPAWLAPVQAMVLNISEGQASYAAEVVTRLREAGLRVESDLRNEKITYKIREHSLQKLTYLLVVGEKEKVGGQVAVRARGGEDLGAMTLQAFVDRLASECQPGSAVRVAA